MANATIVRAWRDGTHAHLAVRVAEAEGNVEYIGSVPLQELAGLPAREQKAKLVAAVKAVRDAQMNTETDLGLAGTVTI